MAKRIHEIPQKATNLDQLKNDFETEIVTDFQSGQSHTEHPIVTLCCI